MFQLWSHRELRIKRASGAAPIYPLEQHRELRTRHRHGAGGGLRPHEAPALEALREQTQPISIPPEHLDAIAATTAKDKELSGERILSELQLRECAESIKSLPQVRDAGGQPHLHPRRKGDHRRQSSSTRRSRTRAAALPWMRTRPPLARSISRKSPRAFLAGAGALCAARRYLRFATRVGEVTFTGSKGTAGAEAFGSNNPFWYSLRHPKTRLAFTPCACATIATEALGLRVSSTISRFSRVLRSRRGPFRRPRASVATASTDVSISPPSGHVLRVHLSGDASSAKTHLTVMRCRPDAYKQSSHMSASGG